ncbi:uncharacterized protein PG986_001755 [Apiospora aurea]|uniref:LrgB-like protein n=1 Tax=Apiospora aurea TaxID=335848 RepID=A0ABR1QXU5_9PEZI
MTWISQICLAVKSPETAGRYRNAAIGVLLVPLTQLLVVPIQTALVSHEIILPASVLVMLTVTMTMLAASLASRGVSNFYFQYMKGPVSRAIFLPVQYLVDQSLTTARLKTDFLGRHMAFGFVPAFVMLSKGHLSSAVDVPRIAGALIITTLTSYIGCYIFATSTFRLESSMRGLGNRVGDAESQTEHTLVLSTKALSAKRVSQMFQLTIGMFNSDSFSSLETCCSPPGSTEFFVRTPPLWIALFLLLTVGVPIYCATGYEMPFEVFCFIFLWIGTVLFQRSLRTFKALSFRPRLQTTLVVICNPVLVTAALGTAYFWTKTAVTHQSIEAVLGTFKRHDDWAQIVAHIAQDRDPRLHLGAGDLATALLDAGIVSLGLKMFEYRAELWRGLATVLSTSLVAAAVAVFLNVALAHALGLAAAEALAFAARNVTIALGAPAVLHLGGSTTLMSALVIFSGMLYQMAGDLVFAWLAIPDQAPPSSVASGIQYALRGGGVVMAETNSRSNNSNNNAATTSDSDAEDEKQGGGSGGHATEQLRAESKIVAAGVTVGINAAAMGTSHLLERDSRATAYSALSMTMFGCITVGLTSIPTIAHTLQVIVAR